MNRDRPDPSRPEDPDHGLDVDAAFADIVARFGPLEPPAEERDEEPTEKAPEDAGDAEPEPAPEQAPDQTSEQVPSEPLQTPASWDDEGHFVPPPPPPLPTLDPRRKLAWTALLGSPVVALLLAVLRIGVPGWLGLLLVVGFVGGFGYLVATMRSSPPDDWSDDGARL